MSPPPESHEKRQRDRRKQQKRKEKRERKQQRKDEKRNTRAYYVLRRGDEQHGVDSDLWLGALDIAAVGGWTPPAPESDEVPPEGAYAAILRPAGLELDAEQALGLGKSIETMLPAISEDEQPLSNRRFGEDYTGDLLTRRTAGEKLALDDAGAALELLSGQPRQEVELLATFLKAGPVSFEVAL